MVLGLNLNEVQVSPKGKKRNEVSFFGNLVTPVRQDRIKTINNFPKGQNNLLYLPYTRGVAQPGRASALGAECRQFESGYPDTKNATPLGVAFCIVLTPD